MNLKVTIVATIVFLIVAHGVGTAAEPTAVSKLPTLSVAAEKVILADGDILDRRYRILGQVFVRAKKVGIIDRPSIETKTDILLKAKAAELGADALINVRRERKGMSIFSFGHMDGFGTAIAFSSSDNVAVTQQPAPSDQTVTKVSPKAAVAPQASLPPPVVENNSTDPLELFIDALNSNEMATASSLFGDDAVIEDPAGSRPIVGRDALESYLSALIARGARYELLLPVGNSGMGAAAMALRVHSGLAVENTIHAFTFAPNGRISRMKIYRDPKYR
ncbi:MAG TPA: hypothetical protein DGZ24_07575 [Rhodospirillaceae bacterium]|nr:hypothetical protein [Candidatus Neomarinimicrobiota bacterium]HCX15159.1 hypothetical protein [Rhodospirillaceae bacterium]